MKLVVGLGNIGKEYEGTRHNTGFMVLDHLAQQAGLTFTGPRQEAMIAKDHCYQQTILLAKPTTYMNESGRSVRALLNYYDLEPNDLLVVHDDLDLPTGQLRLRQKGSAGGHNGIKSIIAAVNGQNFKRIRIGIDHPNKQTVVDWVLSRFDAQQHDLITQGIDQAIAAIRFWLETDDFNQAMNRFNHKEK
ncbi:aminoacyl-tRNA hydrolase [Liquorilactobacillus vini]|uniref:Peptidyl-tRNA hydrolase n=1 Tax=Liquorilactobacillus vini DSM 20605 TaxID=1133569 RepID=A0A0R2CJ53_9LACO|nr:aminoacyl-tRNA hydrolase [Liquorilactobacillus vini]KRM88569.1 peptidyl-tRNA hydrolase [Liquorilactobacillus vini DSM 20605]